MSLDTCFAQNQGKTLLIPGGGAENAGQCVMWADTVLHDVYGQPYVYANAIDFWNQFSSFSQLKNNFNQLTDGSVRKGDFVIFNQKVGSVYGHIDVAMQDGNYNQFLGSDTNWGGNKTVHLVNHIGAQYIIGVLRPKVSQGDSMAVQEIADQRFKNEQTIAAEVGWAGNPDQTGGIIDAIKGLKYIANTRGDNAKQIADLVGVTNPDDTNSIVAKIKELQANQGGTEATVLAPGVYKVQ